ncbi:hypothetical protein EST38_g3245 [Candolleomyces aberdarensis]|uniref:HD-associated domain-containing protein n=1 Tax=Candolleomyces aberdarensis TaxID=2316362 RepID=A0A4Q2DQF2_9AGAR|nr:hypothetical protein EST38_g3245 [Candolleomyces aberdarensis]
MVEDDDPHGFFVPKALRGVKDVIHTSIPIHFHLNQFIDTLPFQRLRDIKQLGTSSYVWPSASHTRFEHCLGVAYLARCLASHLQTNQPSLKITNRDVGHVWDSIFMPKAIKGCEWQHERGSEMMFDYIVKNYKIPLSDKDVRFVKALIAGDPTQCDASEKPFLFDIIANKRNGLDVDKFDYIQRDSHMTGTSFSFEATRIVKSARVLDNQICYNIKDANQIYEICLRRFGLHKNIYNHKTARAIEYMIVDALLLAEPHMKIAERVYDPERFLYLNDYILNEIERSKDPELEASRQLIKRFRHRELYREVVWKAVEFTSKKAIQDYITSERIMEKAQKTVDEEGSEEPFDLTADDIIVDVTTMHYGMKERNPVDFTKFYSKKHPDKPMHAGPGDYSGLRPSIHAEILLRIYTKKPEYFGRVYDAYNAVLVDMSEEFSAGADTVPNTPTLASARTPDASSFETLPRTPGADAGDAGTGAEQKKKRAFGRSNSAMMSKNHFADVDRGYRHESPSASTRRMSTGGVAVAVVGDPSAIAVVTTFQPTADFSQLFEDGTEGAIIDAAPSRLKRGREDELQPPIEGIEVKRRKESAK